MLSGIYDEEFIDYTIRALRKCKQYGFKIYMDPHQDVWSRFTGGDGAPYWTLQACGINPRHITATQAAILHNEYPDPSNPDPATLPAMIWGTNYARAASQTLFTLFFAGRDFAPKCIIDGVNIQDYLQSHYIAAVSRLAMRLREAGGLLDECVLGWDSLNEPFEGLCGLEDITVVPKHQQLKKGSNPTPLQSMRLAMGQIQTCEYWDFGSFGPKRNGSVTIDPDGVRLWVDPELADEDENGVSARWGWKRDPGWKLGTCIWALHGVWDPESGTCLRPDYFAHPSADPTREVVFLADYWRPHWRLYTESLRKIHPEHIPFIQPTVFAQPPPLDDDDLEGRCCFSTHYYDGLTLMTRHWNWFNADALGVLRGKYASPVLAVKVGEKAIRASIRDQLGVLKNDCLTILGAYPTMLGEIGTPMDMDHKYSYGMSPEAGPKGKGDYSRQTKALDASLQAADGVNALNYTIWTYAPDSSHVWGEGWNLEDLSLWSADDLMERRCGRRVPYLLDQPEVGKGKSDLRTRMVVHEVNESAASFAAVQEQDDESVPLRTLKSTIQLHRLLLPSRGASTAELTDSTATHAPVHGICASTTATSAGFPAFNSPASAFCFLTNGARAYRAFTRAYPLAAVGIPLKWEFDITRAEFSMTIRVGREDTPYLPQAYDPEATTQEAQIPTEIFVPLVQFASDKVVKEAFGVDAEARIETGMGGSSTKAILPLEDDIYSWRNARPQFVVDDDDDPLKSSSASVVEEPPTPDDDEVFRDALALEITVSAGRTEVSGQVLRWFYPIPPARPPASHKDPREMTPQEEKEAEGDGRVEYTITIKRRGGAIDFPKLGIKGMALEEKESGDDEGWVQRCCGSSCVIM